MENKRNPYLYESYLYEGARFDRSYSAGSLWQLIWQIGTDDSLGKCIARCRFRIGALTIVGFGCCARISELPKEGHRYGRTCCPCGVAWRRVSCTADNTAPRTALPVNIGTSSARSDFYKLPRSQGQDLRKAAKTAITRPTQHA